jgi:coatomer protein complex subunit epsilon
MDPDELYTLRNLFWLGNYQLAINEGNALHRIPANLATEKDEYIYRSYLAMGQYDIIASEIRDSATTPVSHRAIKLLATYMREPSSRDTAKFQMEEWLGDSTVSNNTSLRMIAAMMYMHDDNWKEAMKHVCTEKTFEHCALMVQLYLRIDRLDLAQKMVKSMKAKDEDNTLTMLANAWTLLSQGAAKAQEATYIYEELMDKYGSSALLLNGLAVSKMHEGLYQEAEAHLLESLTKVCLEAVVILRTRRVYFRV